MGSPWKRPLSSLSAHVSVSQVWETVHRLREGQKGLRQGCVIIQSLLEKVKPAWKSTGEFVRVYTLWIAVLFYKGLGQSLRECICMCVPINIHVLTLHESALEYPSNQSCKNNRGWQWQAVSCSGGWRRSESGNIPELPHSHTPLHGNALFGLVLCWTHVCMLKKSR